MSTLVELQEELALWKKARRDRAAGGVLTYSIGGRSLSYMTVDDIQRMINIVNTEISEASGSSNVGFVGISCK